MGDKVLETKCSLEKPMNYNCISSIYQNYSAEQSQRYPNKGTFGHLDAYRIHITDLVWKNTAPLLVLADK